MFYRININKIEILDEDDWEIKSLCFSDEEESINVADIDSSFLHHIYIDNTSPVFFNIYMFLFQIIS